MNDWIGAGPELIVINVNNLIVYKYRLQIKIFTPDNNTPTISGKRLQKPFMQIENIIQSWILNFKVNYNQFTRDH